MSKMVLVLSMLLAQGAFADDGGLVGISVKDLQMSKVTYDDNLGEQLEKIDQPAYKIELSGGESSKLMRILPSESSVLTNMWPKFASTFNANFRSLEITSGDNKPTVTISCQGGDMKFADDGRPSFVAFKDGAKCVVTVAPQKNEDDNIDYSFNPTKDLCHK